MLLDSTLAFFHFSLYTTTTTNRYIGRSVSMTVRILSENLQKRISFLSHAISSKNPLPILQNVLLKAENSQLILSATDLEIGIQIHIPAKVEEEGTVVIPAKTFIDLIASLPSETITLTLKEKTLELIGKKNRSSLQTTNA